MLFILTALAFNPVYAYGESEDGLPSWDQREMHTITNLVRVDPLAWSSDYDCPTIEFEPSERTPKAPLLLHRGLTEIAQLHSEDMKSSNILSHDSSDGTDFGDRVWPYYDGTTIGENVAKGYTSNWEVVLEGWMCSAGHRVNIMAADFDDLGSGIVGKFHTQDFGGGADSEHQAVAMGVHTPESPQTGVRFLSTWDDNKAPASLVVETETLCEEMELFLGEPELGGYQLEVEDEPGCVPYRFVYEESNGRTGALPTTGAWLYGKNCDLWTATAPTGCTPPEPEPEPDPEEECDLPEELDRNGDCIEDSGKPGDTSDPDKKVGLFGCTTGPKHTRSWWILGVVAILVRRKRALD
jgi:hypothetical protein